MKLSNALIGIAALTSSINALAAPEVNAVALDARTRRPESETHFERSTANEELWKRKGGGGGGSRGGGGSSGSSGSSGGSRGGSSGSSGSSSSGGRGSTTSNRGGATRSGSGPSRGYAGGAYYGGGAAAPYAAGSRTLSGIAPALLLGVTLGSLGFIGAAYLYSPWAYPYTHPYTYHNATTNTNETKPVICLCDQYQECSCEENSNTTYINDLLGNGSYQALDRTVVSVAKNDSTGQLTIYINGTLPNGTSAPGGTENANTASGMIALAHAAGWWPAATVAFALAFIL